MQVECKVVEVNCANEQEPHRWTLNPAPERRPFRHPLKKPFLIATRFLSRNVSGKRQYGVRLLDKEEETVADCK